MFNNKNIDRLFQEKFKNFEQQPNPEIWAGIENRLNTKKSKGNFFFLAKLGSFIAIITLVLFSANWGFNKKSSNNTEELQVIINNKSNKDNIQDEITNNHYESESINKGKTNLTKITQHNDELVNYNLSKKSTINSRKNHTIIKKNTSKIIPFKSNKTIITTVKTTYTPQFINEKIFKRQVLVKSFTTSEIKGVYKESVNLSSLSIPINSLDLINYLDRRNNNSDNNKKFNKWQIGSSISPIYFASLSSGSPIDKRVSENKKSSELSFSYGLKVAYTLNKRWSLQSGINNLDLSYLTKDVEMIYAVITNENIETANITTENRAIVMAPMNHNFSIINVPFRGDVKQQISYLEIPMELKYSFLQKKFGAKIVGGISTLFLQKNELTFQRTFNDFELGKSSNLNSINFTANLGFDIDFKVSNNWKMNFTPTFKYHLNTFSHSSGGFKPYSLGFHTGLNYNF